MHKIKIRLPATTTSLGPGLNSLGLALGLYVTVEISARDDDALVVETEGEGVEHYRTDLQHPVVLALIRMFQRLERAPLGLSIKVDNHIPLNSGLGAEAAFTVAGIIAANNLLGNVFDRDEILKIAVETDHVPDPSGFHEGNGMLAAILGGLATSTLAESSLIHCTLPIAPFQIIVVLPELPDYTGEATIPERVPLADMLHNLSRVPLLVKTLESGNLGLLGQVLDDSIRQPLLAPSIPGYDRVVRAAHNNGGLAVTLSGEGPALLVFAEDNHAAIAEAMAAAFLHEGVEARTWVLPVDTQGLVLSVMQSI
jgi:homoserine kinase